MHLNGRQINTGLIHTNENCAGCNKCIGACPVFSANVAVSEDGQNKIYVDQDRCIACGKCMDLCSHGARVYTDDTDRFFEGLNRAKNGGRPVSLIVAPSFALNYPQKYNMILGYLKHLGVNGIYSVSFGADIAVWCYIKHLQANESSGYIAQPCPAIVRCVEKYHTGLVEKLMPVQSPMMCTAIYLRKYLGITDDLAFISPCIAKKLEMRHEGAGGLVEYNVTYAKLLGRLSGVDLSSYYGTDAQIESGVGALFPTPGGLRENIEYYLGLGSSFYVNQKEGEDLTYSFLELYSASRHFDDPYRATLVDILNCSRGCAYGTATEFKNAASNHIPYAINQVRVEKTKRFDALRREVFDTPAQRLKRLNERFEALDSADFALSYHPDAVRTPVISRQERSRIFRRMLKFSDAEQKLDCASCGYQSCQDMAAAIALGYNHRENCVDYVKKKLVIEHSETVHQKQQIEQMSRQGENIAITDQLTGVKNRFGFEMAMEKALASARNSGKVGYLLCTDFDDFMAINDSYGHDLGNALLIAFSRYIQQSFDLVDDVFRVDGDEFAFIIQGEDEGQARAVAEAIVRRAQQPWEVHGVPIYCTASLGMVRFPEADDGVGEIVKNVDLALLKAKQAGKSSYALYSSETDLASHDHVNMLRRMRDAMAKGFAGFEVHYQPWVTVQGRIIGAEALLRWRDEEGNNISPGVFIPAAESAGLIIPLGEFVLKTAARWCRGVNSLMPDFMVSVNVSAKQFAKPDIYESFIAILEDTGVNLSNMVLEITESLGFESVSRQKSIFERFAARGVRVALDDFGTGYSSLSYLNQLPLDLIKIDRSFVNDIENDTYSQYVLSTMSDLMHKMGRRVCVEGVETDSQFGYCKDNKIDIVQGYYFYKPMPGDAFLSVLKEEQP